MFVRWLDRYGLWLMSILISLAFAALDGRYLRAYMFDGPLGEVCAYTGNFLIDLSGEFLAYEFTRHQRDTVQGKARDRKRALSWVLFVGELGLLYFAVVFSWRQATLLMPGEPAWMRWSIALFAQVALLLLGVANALRDVQLAKPREATPEPPEPTPIGYPCGRCEYVGTTQQALNAHKRKHRGKEVQDAR